jgi:hypothetical protein
VSPSPNRLAAVAAVVLVVSAGILTAARAETRAAPVFDPQNFGHSATVNNKWLPLKPGTRFVFRGSSSDGQKRLIFTVTDLVKVVGGVRNAVVWDQDYTDGELVEAELAFFAQDDDGNVWHTGEYPEEYENGKFVGAPAWIAGIKGARAGIEMKVQPGLGAPSYSQGFAPPPVSWTDRAQVVKMSERTCVPLRCFANVLVTREFNSEEPDAYQFKHYAVGVGNIRVGWGGSKNTDKESVALVKLAHLDAAGLAAVRKAALKLERHAYAISKDVYARTPAAHRLTP